MRKLVNGKIVDIKNIEIFEKSAEGIAIARTLKNILPTESISVDFKTIEAYIDVYKSFYKSLPFPLYGIDTDIKYCSAGLMIKKMVSSSIKMWTDNGLYISIDESRNLVLGFINDSWGLVYNNKFMDDNIDIKKYKEEVGFEDFVWVLSNLMKGGNTSQYYATFMPKFVEACNNERMLLTWELGNILSFGEVPDRITLPTNKIVAMEDSSEYSMDIFIAGTRPSRSTKQIVFNLTDDGDVQYNQKTTRVYGYDLYMKPSIKSDENIKPGMDKIKPAEVFGVNSLFCTLCSIKNISESEEFSDYKGFICDNNFIFNVDNRIFVAKADKYVESKEVARGVEIYSYKNNMVYFVKPKIVSPGIKKETIYSYSLTDGNLRLCKIQFVRN